MRLILGIALAGAAGTLTRYAVGTSVQRWVGTVFPWGTLCVNLVGCLLFGLVVGLWETHSTLNPEVRAIILIGFMGAFTTFSTLAGESAYFFREQQIAFLVFNLLLHNVLGILAVLAGLKIATVIS